MVVRLFTNVIVSFKTLPISNPFQFGKHKYFLNTVLVNTRVREVLWRQEIKPNDAMAKVDLIDRLRSRILVWEFITFAQLEVIYLFTLCAMYISRIILKTSTLNNHHF